MIRWIITILVFTASISFAQIEGTTEAGRLIPIDAEENMSEVDTAEVRKDFDPPELTIEHPEPTRGIKVVHKNDVLHLKGRATDPGGIKEVTVNGKNASVFLDGTFKANLLLTPGNNKLTIKAYDNYGNSTEEVIEVDRVIRELSGKGLYYALIIGIDEYQGVWNGLNNAVHDAKTLENLLRERYVFSDIKTLYNEDATMQNIMKTLEWYIDDNNISEDDNVLIYYAGHGYLNDEIEKGYWVPSDAKTNSVSEFVSNSVIKDMIRGISSRHTLLIADACFAGDIFRNQSSSQEGFDGDNMAAFYKKVYKKPSRYALTSGAVEPVMDGGAEGHSVFAYYFLKALKSNDQKYMSVRELYDDFRKAVINNSDQQPQLKVIKNTHDEGGEFVFIQEDK